MKSASPISPASPSALKAFFLAARPKTWSASLCPVLIGGAMAAITVPIARGVYLLTLLFSLFIQIGTNYANDYFDFVKGADTATRKGPKRAVAEGWISPRMMLLAMAVAFGFAFLLAIPLMISAGFWSFGVTALCVLFGVLYTGGPKPLGYVGLGEGLVFLFYGPVATMGTYYLQTGELNSTIFIASLAPGLLSAAILMANNLRDEPTDRIAGKGTLVVRFGASFGRRTYVFFILGAFLVPIYLTTLGFPPKILAASFLLAFAPFKKVFRSIEVLQETSLLLMLYTLLLCYSMLW